MSCVPSINAYVASHACNPGEVTSKRDTSSQSLHTINEPAKERRSWLGSIVDKYIFIGHDGVGIASSQDNNAVMSSKTTETTSSNGGILSRVRHLSNSSTASSESSSPLPTAPVTRPRHDSMPER